MPALSFQKQFVLKIEAGEKEHTIRADRSRPFSVGDVLSLYYGMRTKQCRLLMRRTCTKVDRITICDGEEGVEVTVDGNILDRSELKQLAMQDGFTGRKAFIQFWRGRMPFSGQIIHWRFAEKMKA